MTQTNNNQNIEDGVRYSDMTQEELNKEIEEENKHIELMTPQNYDYKEIDDIERKIERYNQDIQEKKKAYLESMKYCQEQIKKEKKELKKNQGYLKSKLDYLENRKLHVKIITEIRDKLKSNPNHYKENKKQ